MPMPSGRVSLRRMPFSRLRSCLSSILSGDTECAGVGHEYEESSGEGYIGCCTGAFGADLPFGDLDDNLCTDGIQSGNVFDGDFLILAVSLLLCFVVAYDFDGVVARRRKNIPVVEEGVFRLADIDEGCLEAGFEVLYFAFKDGSDFVEFSGSFDFELFKNTFVELRDTLFQRFGINNQFRIRLLLVFNRTDDFRD